MPSLRSALITIVVKQTPEGEKWSAAHGGPVAEVRKRVGNVEMTRFERVKAETVQLVPGQESDWSFDLAETFGIRLFPGDYTIDVQYENRATAEAQVHAKVNEATTVPALINLIESGDPETKVWARNSLFILTGYPEWEIRAGDTEMQLKERLKDLRAWWSVNQPHLKLEGTKLVPK